MLLKWLFTLLAIVWLYEAITRISAQRRSSRRNSYRNSLDDGEYVDYEEEKRHRRDS
jgi:hypothetical protein